MKTKESASDDLGVARPRQSIRLIVALAVCAAVAILDLAGCTSYRPSVMPLDAQAKAEDTLSLMWNGSAEAWRWQRGEWQRSASDDYLFDVVQKRWPDHWESVKTRHYLHPAYNGNAGDRDQFLFFRLDYSAGAGEGVTSRVLSTLGPGQGRSDREFRESGFTLVLPDRPGWPYNRFRITQHYRYESGTLAETVELFLQKDGRELPFMKLEESASIYRKGVFEQPPTVFD